MIFETERLLVRVLDKGDRDAFFDMMGNPKVMNLIPRPVMTREESDDFLNKLMFSKAFDIDKQVSAIVEKKSSNFIGLCAFLKKLYFPLFGFNFICYPLFSRARFFRNIKIYSVRECLA